MSNTFLIHKLKNGVTVLGEQMPGVESGAFAIMVPVGAAYDPDDSLGSAAVLAEMFHKGAGTMDSRALSEAFEDLGAHCHHSAGIEVSIFAGSLLGENLVKVLRLYGTVLREPLLPAEELESVRMLALQELESLEDEPASKVSVELARTFYPGVYGRSQLGTREGLQAITIDSLRAYYRAQFVPTDVVISVAGKFDWQQICDCIEQSFGSWEGTKVRPQIGQLSTTSVNKHINQDTAQLQIALAYPSVGYGHEDYYKAKVAVGVLSGGMSGRLFIEVREKRGLVYRVSASHSGAKSRAAIFGFAGTTPDNAQQTLDVMMQQFVGLADGVTVEELTRAKADLKSRLVIQEELSSSRASALVNDWWNLGRVRTLDEISAGIDAVTCDAVVDYARTHPATPVTLVTLGPKGVNFPS